MSENAYKQAGVDVEAGYESVRLIKDDVKKTAIEGVLGGIGGFGGLFESELLSLWTSMILSVKTALQCV